MPQGQKSPESVSQKNEWLKTKQIELMKDKSAQQMRLSVLKEIYDNMTHHIDCLNETHNQILEHEDFSWLLDPKAEYGTNSVSCNNTFPSKQITESTDEASCYVTSPEGRQDQAFSCSSEEVSSDSDQSSPRQVQESLNQQDFTVSMKKQLEDLRIKKNLKLEGIKQWLKQKITYGQISVAWSLDDAKSVCCDVSKVDNECPFKDRSFIKAIDTMEKNQNAADATREKEQLTVVSAEEKYPNISRVLQKHVITGVNDNYGAETDNDCPIESLCYATSPELHSDQAFSYNSEDSTSSDSDKLNNITHTAHHNQNGVPTSTTHVKNMNETLEKENNLQMLDTNVDKIQCNYQNHQQTVEHWSHRDLKRSFPNSNSKEHKRVSGLNQTNTFASYYSDRQPRKLQRRQSCTLPNSSKMGAIGDMDGKVVAGERTNTVPDTCSGRDSFVLNDKDGESKSKAKDGPLTQAKVIKSGPETESNVHGKSLAFTKNTDVEKSVTISTVEEGNNNASGKFEESQSTISSIVKNGLTTDRKTMEEGQVTASGTVEDGNIKTTRNMEESHVTINSTVKEGQITSSSTFEKGHTIARNTMEKREITLNVTKKTCISSQSTLNAVLKDLNALRLNELSDGEDSAQQIKCESNVSLLVNKMGKLYLNNTSTTKSGDLYQTNHSKNEKRLSVQSSLTSVI